MQVCLPLLAGWCPLGCFLGVKVTTALLVCTQCHDSKDREALVKNQSTSGSYTSTTQLRCWDHCRRGDRKSQRNWELPESLGLLRMSEASPMNSHQHDGQTWDEQV